MKYILLIHHDEQAWGGLSDAERERVLAEFRELRIELTKTGHFLGGPRSSRRRQRGAFECAMANRS